MHADKHFIRLNVLLVFFAFCRQVTVADDAPSSPDQSAHDADVLVYGATPSGISAAVSAAKGDHSVLLVEPTDCIGGMVTCGLSNTDFRSFESLTGFFFDFSQRVQAHYEQRYGENSEQAKAAFRGTHGEPSVNLRVLQAMLAEHPKITVVKKHEIASVETSDFVRGRRRIVSASFRKSAAPLLDDSPSRHPETGTHDSESRATVLKASVFIDASYEGDLMALAGEPYHVGRESRDQYGEPMAGDADGNADGQVQGYNLRLIMTTDKSNMRETPAPDGYKREDFVGVLPVFESGRLKKVFAADRSGIFRAHAPWMPNNKTDMNDTPHAPVRLSMPDINDAYPDGDRETRHRIVQQHYYYNLGLLYFLQNDEAVPPAIRDDARRWGFCRDEFEQTGGISPQLYIREARRLVGQHVFTGRDTRQADGDARSILHTDSIAIGDYVHNCHGTGRSGTRYNGQHDGEFYKPIPPYQIPYGVIVPTKSENLLVPVACSASHFGFGALRLEPIWCSLGQAAGWAASLSLHDNVAVQNVNVPKLQRQLHADRSATIYVSDVPPNSPDFAAVQWFGTQGGLHGLAPAGQPRAKHITGQYNEAFPGHAAELDKPLDATTYRKWQKLPAEDEDSRPFPNVTRRKFINNTFRQRVSKSDGQSRAPISIRSDFPGGNVIVEKIEGDVVTLKPDLRGGRDWFYWSFECQTKTRRKLRFVLPDKKSMKYIGMQGPAISNDGGKTWDWLGADSVDGPAFEFAFEPGKPLRLSVTIPYMQSNVDQLLAEHKDNEHLTVTELAKTRSGRPVELLQIGQPGDDRIPVLMTARHHACETMASYLLEGFLRAAMSDTEAGRSFRERYVLYCVPIVDKDGVHNGDQGKNRNPHDHNRDYIDEPLYPEVAAIMKLRENKGIRIAVDFHCPTLWMDYHQVIYFVGPKDVPANNHANVTQLATRIKAEFPKTAPRGGLVLLKSQRPPGHFSDYFSRAEDAIMATTLEFPYASPGKIMRPAAVVTCGRDLLRAWMQVRFE